MALFLMLGFSASVGCTSRVEVAPSPVMNTVSDGAVFQRCGAICLRPSDCTTSYTDDDYCPPGYLCATTFHCLTDGGAGD